MEKNKMRKLLLRSRVRNAARSNLTCLIGCFFATGSLFSACNPTEPIGMIGGDDGMGNMYAAYISVAGVATPIASLPLGGVSQVEINNLGSGLIGAGGAGPPAAYAALSFPPDSASSLDVSSFSSAVNGVAFNDAGYGLLVPSTSFIGTVNPEGAIQIINISPGTVNGFKSAAINNQNLGLIVGSTALDGYAAFVDVETGVVSPITGLSGVSSSISWASLNDSGIGLIGGADPGGVNGYAAFVDAATNTAVTILPPPVVNIIGAAAINNSSVGLLITDGYAAIVSPSSSPLSLPLSITSGNDVAINNKGTGLIVWDDLGVGYAAFVNTATGFLTPIALPSGTVSAFFCDVNDFGIGLLAIEDSMGVESALLVFPSGATLPISPLPASLGILSISLVDSIPIGNLTGNAKAFAQYLNAYAPELAAYFLPALLNCRLAEALNNASSARNAIGIFAMDQNLFALNRGLSNHTRNHRHFGSRFSENMPASSWCRASPLGKVGAFAKTSRNEELAGDFSQSIYLLEKIWPKKSVSSEEGEKTSDLQEALSPDLVSEIPILKNRPYTLWFEAIGAWGWEKKTEEMVGFAPGMGGAVLGFDRQISSDTILGLGAAYTLSYIGEELDAGHIDIHEEYLFFYASWSKWGLYFDGALWSGFFQMHQVRNIDLFSFGFKTVSHPVGAQISPHWEFGYEAFFFPENRRINEWGVAPFAMMDWANTWENSYEEKGHCPFNTRQNSHYSSFLRSEAGVRFYEVFPFSFWRLVLEEKCSYVNQTPFGVGTVKASLIGLPGFFTFENFTQTMHFGAVEMGFIFEPIDPKFPYGSFSYQGEYGSSSQIHQLTTEVSWNF